VKTPVRWLDAAEGDAPVGARDLLSAASSAPAFTDAVRYRMAVGVAKTATLPVASPWPALLAKGAVVAALGGVSGFLVHNLASQPAPAQLPVATPVTMPAASPPVEPNMAPPVSVDSLPELQLPDVPADRAPRLKVDPRLAEAELLEKARGLVGANPNAALKLTVEHARDFPKGRLGAEADLIAAQALLGLGKRSTAKERARASLTRYPNGIYARQLRDIAEAP
jgi:hypothetical protein